MPRFESPIPQFIVPEEDLPTMTAAPFKPTRSHSRKKSNSISALERIVVFTEATQRVKRRLRNVIAGAVGASTSRPKRKSRDIMHVDYVWNGWFEPSEAPIDPSPEPVPRPRQTTVLPNFAPTINRYSVNMDAKSISDVSMDLGESDDEGASTPRATSPEPGTPVAAAKGLKTEEENDEGEDEERDDNDEDDEEEGEEEAVSASKDEPEEDESAQSKQADDTVSVFSPMDEDPIESPDTPKATSPTTLPSKPSTKKHFSPSVEDDSEERTPPLTIRTSSTESTPPKTPKLTLITNFIRTPVQEASRFLTGMVDAFTASPACLGLDLEAEVQKFKALDLMEVIPSSALSQDGGALPYAAKVEPVKEVLQKPALIPAVKLIEKPGRKSRRSSRASETTEAIVCSPRRASILAAKKNSKGSLNGVERAQDIVSPTTMLRAKIDSLPLEQDDSIPAWGLWKLQTNLSYLHQNSSENSIQTVHNVQ